MWRGFEKCQYSLVYIRRLAPIRLQRRIIQVFESHTKEFGLERNNNK
jgi:hypothetical protein